jgi:DNA-binding MarR family transcriptional regulator
MNTEAQLAGRNESRGKRSSTHLARNHGPSLELAHLRRMAEFRYQLRRFLHVSQMATEQMGLRPQQYQMLQCVVGMPDGMEPTIANVAKRMLLKHNSAVELVDRAIEKDLLRRSGDALDHRRILLRVTPQGERILASLAAIHTRELEQSGPELVRALDHVLRAGKRTAAPAAESARLRKAGSR